MFKQYVFASILDFVSVFCFDFIEYYLILQLWNMNKRLCFQRI